MPHVVVVGAGGGGVFSPPALARRGVDVTVLDRDDAPVPDRFELAGEWRRPGTPQTHHTHFFKSRLNAELRDHLPEVIAELSSCGITPAPFSETMPESLDDRSARPG